MVTRKALIIGLGLLVVGSATVWAVSGQLGLGDDTPASEHARHRGMGAGFGHGAHGPGHGGQGNHTHDGNHTHGDHGNGTHGHHGGHGPGHKAIRGPGHGAVAVARCLSSDNQTDEECVAIAERMAQARVDRAVACLEDQTARECAHGAPPPVGRTIHCVEENGAETCAEKITTHLVCQASRIAGVDPPIECPAPTTDEVDNDRQ